MKRQKQILKERLKSVPAILICIPPFMLLCAGCAKSFDVRESARAQKGYYPQGCVVTCGEDVDEFPGETYVLSGEAYRALFFVE